jgi:hypothetical protein
MDPARARLVDGYWSAHRLRRSSVRSERLAADGWQWAVDDVDAAMGQPDDSALQLLDDLMCAPDADVGYLGAGPLEDLLAVHGVAVADQVADRARKDPLWRLAVGAVWLDSRLVATMPGLALFLPSQPDS